MSPPSHTTHQTNFKRIQSFGTDYSSVTVTQYESRKTGMRVVVVDQEGPLVHGSFALATEIDDDSGAPHTLEHLCFMGSKNYPSKDILDKFSARAYSDLNAATYTDRTVYSLESAGWEGFAQILPVYLDHIITPLLTDASCYTEVHHVDGDGNDAGVVYSEMQSKENEAGQLMFLETKRMLYPEGVGYRYETFGVMESLRALSPDRIRRYHQDMYQPRNLCLIIIGMVDHANLLSVLDEFEDTIPDNVTKPNIPFQRPWVDSKQVPPLQQSCARVLEFPEEDESSGEITISFFGPLYTDKLLCRAMVILLTYLAGSSASVLENTLVEREQVASAVIFDFDLRPQTAIHFDITGVATEELERVEARFFEILRETAARPIDMGYMRDCIKREKCQVKFYAETSAQWFTEPVTNDFLFGNRDGSTLRSDLENLQDYDALGAWSDAQWRHWLKAWMAEAPHVTVLGKPSALLSAKLESEEKARVEARRRKLGNQGLKNLEKRLTSAKEENDKGIPKAYFKRFKIPSTSSIHFINTTTARSGAARLMGHLANHAQELIDRDRDNPLFIHFEDVQSNFAYITLVMGTGVVPVQFRPLLAIYMESFFSMPMLRDGTKISFEQVIMELERDTVGYEIESGANLGNSETISIKLQVEAEKYQTGIQWLRRLMWSSVFDLERIKATTTRLLADIPDDKRDGGEMVTSIELMVGTAPSSAARARNTLVKAVYLKRIKRLLEKEPQTIIDQLKEVNVVLCAPENIRVLVAASIEKLQRPVSSWEVFTENQDNGSRLNPLGTRLSRLSEKGRHPGDTAYIVPMPPLDSSFLLAVGKGPSSFHDAIYPALMVATSYLSSGAGPLWVAIRGTGLAYTASFSKHVDSGQVSLFIGNSPDPFKAFVASREVVQNLVSNADAFDSSTLEAAISCIVLRSAYTEATSASAAESSFARQVLRGLPKDWPSVILERVRKVKVEEIRRAMKHVLLPLFEPTTTNLFVTCAPIMEQKAAKAFSEIGFAPEVKPLAFFQDDYGLSGEEESDEESEEDIDDDTEDDSDDGSAED